VRKITTTPRCKAENTHTADTQSLPQDLQAVLGQLFDLQVQGVEAHPHFVGTRSAGFQRQLEVIVQTAREASNAVGNVLREFDGGSTPGLIITEVPPAIPGLSPGECCTTAAVNVITHRISVVLNTIRRVCNQLGDADASTAALLGEMADAIENQALILVAESQRINSVGYSDITPSAATPFEPPAGLGSER